MKQSTDFYGTEKISKIFFKLAPPVMLAQLIQALYNIIDSLFIGRYSDSCLTALSIIYPIQLLMIAIGVGTGVGINTSIAYYLGIKKQNKAKEVAGIGTPLAFVLWFIFAFICYLLMPAYAHMSTNSDTVINEVIIYGRIVSVFSMGLFFESNWSKILQANGDMKTPMYAQIAGAVTNIILDPILMQSAYTFYILGLNLILAGFSDQAVTALGLYYKWQTFFFIPLGALQICIIPIISYNYAATRLDRCKKTLSTALIWGVILMSIGTLCFEIIPTQMLMVFTRDREVIDIGSIGFRIIGISFIPMVTSLIFPVFFQAIGYAVKSSVLTIVRTVVLFVPLGFLFSRIGLEYFWLTYPITELLTSLLGVIFYKQFLSFYN